MEKKTSPVSWKERNFSAEYENIKKIPDEYSNLRQTFDSRTNSRLQEKFAKYGLN